MCHIMTFILRVFPLDMLKTRLQYSRNKSTLGITSEIWTREGPRGFYRGLAANLAGVTPEKAIKLAVNDYARDYFAKRLGIPDGMLPLKFGMLAGALAGFCQVLATNPMEMVKIQMQLQTQKDGRVLKSTWQVVKELGPRGMYRGTLTTWMRDIPFSIVFFSSYAVLKERTSSSFVSGLLAGCLASAMATPMDVIKTRYQSERNGRRILDLYKETFKREGLHAFFKGVLPRCLIVSPLFGISLMVYDIQKSWLK